MKVVVTGLGVVSSAGIGKASFWDSICEGRSGVKTLEGVDTSRLKTKIAGQVADFDPSALSYSAARNVDRFTQLALKACEEAVEESGVTGDPSRMGVILGTGVGGIGTIDNQQYALHTHARGPQTLHPLTVPKAMFNAAAGHIAIHYGVRGPNFTVSTACSSGASAIGEAVRLIRHGYADAIIAGGTEAPLSYGMFAAWNAMRVMSVRNGEPGAAVRPFSKDRDGLVLSEGAAIVVLEREDLARKRGAPIYAEVTGYGCSNDGFHATRPSVDGQVAAIKDALCDAQMSPDDIDYINAHGTATTANDVTETEAVKQVLGDRAARVPMSSIKSRLGHALGASGAIEFVSSCLSLRDGIVPPTINLHSADPDCDLDYVPNEARQMPLNAVMSNTFAFGGCNVILTLRKPGTSH
ncbi:beta-ketoacyl-ACP synthase II [Abyssibacter sp.]|uniref:beta-ketoacyl-ACP synthase II n=1 Tax=Abyssibacter sp. TaxID=2320200 RepID=UPI0035148131